MDLNNSNKIIDIIHFAAEKNPNWKHSNYLPEVTQPLCGESVSPVWVSLTSQFNICSATRTITEDILW